MTKRDKPIESSGGEDLPALLLFLVSLILFLVFDFVSFLFTERKNLKFYIILCTKGFMTWKTLSVCILNSC